MISVKIKGIDPNEIREQAKVIFGLVEPTGASLVGDIRSEPQQVQDLADASITVHEELPPKEVKKTRAKKQEAPAPVVDDVGERPAFLDAKPKAEKEAEIDPAALLEKLRGTANQLLEAGTSMEDIVKVVGTFKTADDKKALKMSQIAPASLPKAIAAFEALLPAKG